MSLQMSFKLLVPHNIVTNNAFSFLQTIFVSKLVTVWIQISFVTKNELLQN